MPPQPSRFVNASAGTFALLFVLFAIFAFLPPRAAAQRGGSAGHFSAPAHATPHRFNSRTGGSLHIGRGGYPGSRRSPYASPYTSLPFPFFGDSFDPDDIYSTGYPDASQPPPYLMQALSSMGPAPNTMESAMSEPARDPSSTQPLMIELQNGHYVRVHSTAINDAGDATPLAPLPTATAKSSGARSTPLNSTPPPTSASASPLAPAVLIFRDGHSEEVRDYTIADGFLYARGDYYTDGYWNKKIDLATLDLTRTEQANADHNVNFVLPSSPNEVITRF